MRWKACPGSSLRRGGNPMARPMAADLQREKRVRPSAVRTACGAGYGRGLYGWVDKLADLRQLSALVAILVHHNGNHAFFILAISSIKRSTLAPAATAIPLLHRDPSRFRATRASLPAATASRPPSRKERVRQGLSTHPYKPPMERGGPAPARARARVGRPILRASPMCRSRALAAAAWRDQRPGRTGGWIDRRLLASHPARSLAEAWPAKTREPQTARRGFFAPLRPRHP